MTFQPFHRLRVVFNDLVLGRPSVDEPVDTVTHSPGERLPRVLCVDDEEIVRKTLHRQLKDHYETVTAASAAEALAILAAEEPFDVILCDLRMPGMSGLAFLHKALEVAPTTQRVILTGHVDPTTMAVARSAGHAIHLLTKPCTTTELRQAIASAVERRQSGATTTV